MIPLSAFYFVCILWLATMAAWLNSMRHQEKAVMEILRLFRSNTIAEFDADKVTSKRQGNYMRGNIDKAYAKMEEAVYE